MLTREERLWTMKGQDLIKAADKVGVKVKCNRVRTQLKEAKENVIARILEAEHIVEEINKAEEEKELEEKLEKEAEDEVKAMYGDQEDKDDQNDKNDQEDKNNQDEKNNIYNDQDDQDDKPADTDGKSEQVKRPAPKKGAQFEYDGRSQNICAWAKELGISANTLYGRIYKLGWSVEKAFTTPSRKCQG